MPYRKPLKQILVSCAVLILTFLTGFVTGGIQKTYDPQDCNRSVQEKTDAP